MLGVSRTGDYIAYMTPTTKDTRRNDWRGLNFAGSIDWALDLQSFTGADYEKPPELPHAGGQGCIRGDDLTVNSGDLCQFSCHYGFCPETVCECLAFGNPDPPPSQVSSNARAYDDDDPDLNRLCKFACTHGYCPEDSCNTSPPELDAGDDSDDSGDSVPTPIPVPFCNSYASCIEEENGERCKLYEDGSMGPECKRACAPVNINEAANGHMNNYGCVAFTPAGQEQEVGTDMNGTYYKGTCSCNNSLVNSIAEFTLEAMAVIAEVCFGGMMVVLRQHGRMLMETNTDWLYHHDDGPQGRVEGWRGDFPRIRRAHRGGTRYVTPACWHFICQSRNPMLELAHCPSHPRPENDVQLTPSYRSRWPGGPDVQIRVSRLRRPSRSVRLVDVSLWRPFRRSCRL